MEPKATGPGRVKIEPLLGGLALLLLLIGCFFVLRPFMTALMWAIILTCSLYPLQRKFTAWFRGSRTLAACLVTLTVTVVFVGPVVLIGMSLAQDGKELAMATRKWFMSAPDTAPAWIRDMPVVGDEVEKYWEGFSQSRNRWMEQLEKEVVVPGPDGEKQQEEGNVPEKPVRLVAETATDAGEAREDVFPQLVVILGRFLAWTRTWLVAAGLAVGQGITQVLLSAFLAFFLLRDAPELSQRLSVAVERLAGHRGKYLIKVAGDTVRGVIFGVLGTALIQAMLAGLGFWIAGVPGVVLLSVLTFFFAVIPFGPPLIWLPAALWVFTHNRVGFGIFLLLWGVFVISSVDNVVRPLLISQGSKMPFVLIFCGVIGGALSFGLVGVFLGPTVLAVTFRLIEEWSATRPVEVELTDGGNSELRDGPGSDKPPHGGESLGVG
jgi:predicted PurR-regulated permease PerM